MGIVCSIEEREKIDSFKRECKMDFERSEYQRKMKANRSGQEFVPGTYNEPSDNDCLAVVRAGWKSELDKRFESKFKREKNRNY